MKNLLKAFKFVIVLLYLVAATLTLAQDQSILVFAMVIFLGFYMFARFKSIEK